MKLPPMISYAQNAEDVVLRRAFADLDIGFYIDVGACHPLEDSVTQYFYERGWRGINIEPDASLCAKLTAARTRDTNLCLAMGSKHGEVTFYPTGTRGHGTLSRQLATDRAPGPEPQRVLNLPLSVIFDQHAKNEEVQFLKVDVEGAEEDVIKSGDFRRHRPQVIVVEAVDSDGRPTHATWEPVLLEAHYSFVLFDGLNRFYCCKEKEDLLLPRLAAPANIFDNYRIAQEVRALEASSARAEAEASRASSIASAHQELKREHRLAHERIQELDRELTNETQAREALGADRDALIATIRELERLLTEERTTRDLLRLDRDEIEARAVKLQIERDDNARRARQGEHSLAEERAARQALRLNLRTIKSSGSWRITKPIRAMATMAILLRRGG